MLDLNLNVDLNIENISKLINDYFNKEGFMVISIEPKLKTQSIGSQMYEENRTIFDGFNIKLKKNNPKENKPSSDGWF